MGRKTITLPDDLERQIETEARRRGASFSATVVDVLAAHARGRRTLPYAGVADGEPDDSIRAEEVLDEIAARWRD